MRMPKNLRDKDPLLGDLPQVETAMEYSDQEWTAEELDDVDRQVSFQNTIIFPNILTLGMLRKNFSMHFEVFFFSYFFQKIGFDISLNCPPRRQFA